MTIATAKLTEEEHARFMDDLSLTECEGFVTVTREGETTTVSNRSETSKSVDGMSFFFWSLEEGFLHAWGYHKKFTKTE